VESEGSFFTGGDDGAEKDAAARARGGVDGNGSDEGTRDTGLMKVAVDLKAVFRRL